jgi:hypothetical protein
VQADPPKGEPQAELPLQSVKTQPAILDIDLHGAKSFS